jgi:hypothetical protein
VGRKADLHRLRSEKKEYAFIIFIGNFILLEIHGSNDISKFSICICKINYPIWYCLCIAIVTAFTALLLLSTKVAGSTDGKFAYTHDTGSSWTMVDTGTGKEWGSMCGKITQLSSINNRL